MSRQIALAYLEQYQESQNSIIDQSYKVDMARTKAEGVGSTLGLPTGWTGEVVQEELLSPGKPGLKGRITKHMSKVLVPLPRSKYLADRQSEYLADLVDQVMKVEEEVRRSETICLEIENTVEQACSQPGSIVIKGYFLARKPIRDIADALHISKSKCYRILDDSLEELGDFLLKVGKFGTDGTD